MASAKPMKTKNTTISATRATGFHFTQAETASETRARTRIQAQLPTKMAKAMPAFSRSQPAFEVALEEEEQQAGHPGDRESRITSTDILPSTYSARENGRER